MHDYITFINKMLAQAVSKRTFKTRNEQSVYEKGYLIGLLASLAYHDSDVFMRLRKKFKEDGGSARN